MCCCGMLPDPAPRREASRYRGGKTSIISFRLVLTKWMSRFDRIEDFSPLTSTSSLLPCFPWTHSIPPNFWAARSMCCWLAALLASFSFCHIKTHTNATDRPSVPTVNPYIALLRNVRMCHHCAIIRPVIKEGVDVDVLHHPRCRFRRIEVSCRNTNKYFDMGRLTSSSTLLTFPSLFLLGFNYEVALYRALRSTNHSFSLSSSHSFETYVRPFPNTSFVFPQFNFN